MTTNLNKKALFFFVLLNLSYSVFSQKSDSTKVANYFGGGVTVTNKGNKTIQSQVPGHKDFVWNASLIYSFNNNYVKK